MSISDSTPRYATLAEIVGWLSQQGYDDLLDSDVDGTVESGEETTFGLSALSYACSLIDGAICEQVNPEVARASGNLWLKDRCIDLAVFRISGHGGRDIPDSIQQAYELAIDLLKDVKDGARIPGYAYPVPVNADHRRVSARVVNVFSGFRGCR